MILLTVVMWKYTTKYLRIKKFMSTLDYIKYINTCNNEVERE